MSWWWRARAVGGERALGGRLCVHDARPRLPRRLLHMVRGGEASGPRARDATYLSTLVCPRRRDGVGDGGARAVLRCARLWGWR